jgi:hypothetical protein
VYIELNRTLLKRLLAIFLLSVHLFMLFGYHLVFEHFESGSDRRMVERLDVNGYNPEDLVELRIPVQLPYHPNWVDYERVDGEINIDGKHYNYVGRRMVNDTLILKVIPNHDKTRIRHARETFLALVNDMQDYESTDHAASLPMPPKKPFSFEAVILPGIPISSARMVEANLWAALEEIGLNNQSLAVPEPPPDLLV